MKLSIIIPSLNEGDNTLRTLESLYSVENADNMDVIVLDDLSDFTGILGIEAPSKHQNANLPYGLCLDFHMVNFLNNLPGINRFLFYDIVATGTGWRYTAVLPGFAVVQCGDMTIRPA